MTAMCLLRSRQEELWCEPCAISFLSARSSLLLLGFFQFICVGPCLPGAPALYAAQLAAAVRQRGQWAVQHLACGQWARTAAVSLPAGRGRTLDPPHHHTYRSRSRTSKSAVTGSLRRLRPCSQPGAGAVSVAVYHTPPPPIRRRASREERPAPAARAAQRTPTDQQWGQTGPAGCWQM